MEAKDTTTAAACPELAALLSQARTQFETLLHACADGPTQPFGQFEGWVFRESGRLACCLVRVFLLACHQRLDLRRYLADGSPRESAPYAERTLRTRFGEVPYGRHYLTRKGGGGGFHPRDVELELTRDGFTPWVIAFVTQLATRLSYQAATRVCHKALGWAPSAEEIGRWVLGLGRRAGRYLEHMPLREPEGEVLGIEIDGKCTPTATQTELAKRRRPRRARTGSCRCQRHRGRAKRPARGPRKRRQKGDHSKNGRETVTVVMSTLRRGADGLLHGPVNKKVWSTYAGRRAAIRWARAEATRRGFPPGTAKGVQVLRDGAKGLKQNVAPLFPGAIRTLDIRHVEEKLWDVGRLFHKEGSAELAALVDELKELLYQGQIEELVGRLQDWQRRVAPRGPGTARRRKVLRQVSTYLQTRADMMRYARWLEQDLVIATGQVEGAVRHVVGQRMDAAGMRWIPERAEALLRLRCIESNGDWDDFFAWAWHEYRAELQAGQKVRIRTAQPIPLENAA
jgi:hypothetical protein